MISFSLPWALVGLVAAALPLLLHLVQKHEVPEVVFPAVRYLEDATRDQQRRLKFRHWLLLIVRTLLIVALVFAAAGATMRRSSFGPHAPGALVLVIDNSAGSGAVIDGEPLLDALVRAAGRVLDHATVRDRVWLIAADGVARAGAPADLRRDLASLRPDPVRLDLGRAVGAGRDLIRGSKRPGEVVVVSSLQRSALSAARGEGDVLVVRPGGAPPANRGITMLTAGLQPWSPAGGRVTIAIVSTDTAPVPVTLSVGTRPLRDVLVTPGAPSVQRIGPQPPGWLVVTATLPPDEFRVDDSRSIAVRVAPPVAVQWDSSDRYLDAAARVLANDGRIRSGGGIRIGTLGLGPSVVMPPEDPAHVGALNRSLAARGISWHFGTAVTAAEQLDSGAIMPANVAVSRRYTLEHDGAGDVLATVGGAPWLVRAGDVLLLGSRLDPSWTALPLSASFVPFLDAMLTSAAPGTAISREIIAGEAIRLPDRVTAVVHDRVVVPAAGGSAWTPRTTGVFHLLAGVDTLGAMSVRVDPRESDLSRATDRDVRALWQGATVAGLTDGPGLAFATAGRGDLRGALLALALVCALIETVLVGRVVTRGL
ncbi:MAG TPA: BatA domain-containing protein [Gemmatimonadales bacterium]|jgi:hypothetical protein